MGACRVQSLNWENPLEKEMAAPFSILAWKIPWTEEPGWLRSVGVQSQTRLNRNNTFSPLWDEYIRASLKQKHVSLQS